MGNLVMAGQLILALSILIVLHECGHFFPARWFNTRVEKFYLFFDPWFSLAKKKIGDTEYGIGWLPLGGYVKIAGMVDESMDKEQLKLPPQPWEFRSKPAWQRLIIMLGGVTVNFILGFFLFAMVLWVWGKEFLPTEEAKYGFAMDSSMIRAGFRNGDVILSVGDRKLEKVEPGQFMKEVLINGARSATVRREGDMMQKVDFGDQLVSDLQDLGSRREVAYAPQAPFIIGEAVAGKPAAEAGLQKGDQLLKVNSAVTMFSQNFREEIKKYGNNKVELTYLRGKDTLRTSLVVSAEGTIGVMQKDPSELFSLKKESFSLAQAVPQGIADGWNFLGVQVSAFKKMVTGELSARKNLGGFVDIARQFGDVWDWQRFWAMTASLSILLAFMNLLPIPALDGGYVLFLIWEIVSGKKVSDEFMEKAVTIGFFLLLALLVYANGLSFFR